MDQPPDQVAEVEDSLDRVDLGRKVARLNMVFFHLLSQKVGVDIELVGVLDPHPDQRPVEVGEELVSRVLGEEVGRDIFGFGLWGILGHGYIIMVSFSFKDF